MYSKFCQNYIKIYKILSENSLQSYESIIFIIITIISCNAAFFNIFICISNINSIVIIMDIYSGNNFDTNIFKHS